MLNYHQQLLIDLLNYCQQKIFYGNSKKKASVAPGVRWPPFARGGYDPPVRGVGGLRFAPSLAVCRGGGLPRPCRNLPPLQGGGCVLVALCLCVAAVRSLPGDVSGATAAFF